MVVRRFRIRIDGQEFEVEAEEILADTPPELRPRALEQGEAVAHAPATPEILPAGDGLAISAPLPGTIAAIKVGEGDQVVAGQVLVILEAMKMENEISAPKAGTVKQIAVEKGQSVAVGDALVIIG